MAARKSSSGKKKGADGKACWKGYRYAGTSMARTNAFLLAKAKDNKRKKK